MTDLTSLRDMAERATPGPWRTEDLIRGSAYTSKNFGPVEYVGLDHFYGETTHHFRTGRSGIHSDLYILPSRLDEFLEPKILDVSSEDYDTAQATIAAHQKRIEALEAAGRAHDKVRQSCRRAGWAEVLTKPRRWSITDAGRKALEGRE